MNRTRKCDTCGFTARREAFGPHSGFIASAKCPKGHGWMAEYAPKPRHRKHRHKLKLSDMSPREQLFLLKAQNRII